MCSNYQPIIRARHEWVKQHFGCDLPAEEWRPEAYPLYPTPFIYLDERDSVQKPTMREVKRYKRNQAFVVHGKKDDLDWY